MGFVVNPELWLFLRAVKRAPTPENWNFSVICDVLHEIRSVDAASSVTVHLFQSHVYNSG